MSEEIGELSVEAYVSLTTSASRGENNVFLKRAMVRHGLRERAVELAGRFAGLLEQFAKRFGKDRRVCLYESPGRVNLMGMHVDHRGGIVNPVATRERIYAVCGRNDDDCIRARSLSGDYGEGEFRISDRLPPKPLGSLGEWLNWTETEAVAFGGGKHFVNYLACGPLYAACFAYPWGRKFAGVDFLLDSDLPASSGLASSSALVVMATDFFLRSNPEGVEELSVDDLLELYGYGEWYIGTRGGTGDQAAIKLCRRGTVQPIITTPEFQARPPAPFPGGYDIFLYPSGDAANKSVEPFKTAFNAPIISYQAAEVMLTDFAEERHPARLEELLAGRASLDARHQRVYLGDAVNGAVLSDAELYGFLRSLPRVMSQKDVFSLFEEHAENFRAGLQQASEPEGGYHVRDAAAFGFSECARAEHAGQLLATGDMEGFARMMNVSQLGDRVGEVADSASRRIKFLDDKALAAMENEQLPIRRIAGDYHVSTTNIDRMVSICLDCPDVLGARLSGAGLGGMLIVLGREGFDETLDPILTRDYYEPLAKELRKIRIVPSEGAGAY
ncbi:MAG: galactokinase family protein [Planctomycetota bacterium]